MTARPAPAVDDSQGDGAVFKACGVCRRAYAVREWRALRVVETLPFASVQLHLSVPAPWAIELRGCMCGALLAARSDSAPRD